MLAGHIQFHMSTTTHTITGINDLGAIVTITRPDGEPMGNINTRAILYRQKVDKSKLILQATQLLNGDVVVVHPNTKEAEQQMEMMCRNFPVFVVKYLSEVMKVPDQYVKKLADRGLDSSKLEELPDCTWSIDEEGTFILETPASRASANALDEWEQQSWVLDIEGLQSNKKTRNFTNPTSAFNFEDGVSINTIHQKNVQFAEGSEEEDEVQEVDKSGKPVMKKSMGINLPSDNEEEEEEEEKDSPTTVKDASVPHTNAKKRGILKKATAPGNKNSSGSSDDGDDGHASMAG